MRKGEVKGGGIKNGNKSASWILLLDSPFKGRQVRESLHRLQSLVNQGLDTRLSPNNVV